MNDMKKLLLPTAAVCWLAGATSTALVLAESGNLLLMGPRLKDRGKWVTLSRALPSAAAAGVKAADARNLDALTLARDRIVLACETCHEPYRDGGRKMPIN
jgi:hypothetical protein